MSGSSALVKQDGNYLKCKCTKCTHQWRKECIENHCSCCDLEDGFSLAVGADWDSR